MKIINKYGLRFGAAFFVAVLWQVAAGWDWLDFTGRSVTTILVVAATYPIESWWKMRSQKPADAA